MVKDSELLNTISKHLSNIRDFVPYPMFGIVLGAAAGMLPTLYNKNFVQEDYHLYVTKFNYHISIGCVVGSLICGAAGYKSIDWDS